MNETGGQKSVIPTGLHREPIYFVLPPILYSRLQVLNIWPLKSNYTSPVENEPLVCTKSCMLPQLTLLKIYIIRFLSC